MSAPDITTWDGFWQAFRLAIAMSLIGAVIGHYRTNGVIQLPIIKISFLPGSWLMECPWYLKPLRYMYLLLELVRFVVGFRFLWRTGEDAVIMHLGFLGDMLVGVGTGILAKATLMETNNTNDYTTVLVSLLAGFAGLSYITNLQSKILNSGKKDRNGLFETVDVAPAPSKTPTTPSLDPRASSQAEAAPSRQEEHT